MHGKDKMNDSKKHDIFYNAMMPSDMVKEQCQINTAGNFRLNPWNDWAFQQGLMIEYSKCQGPLPTWHPVKTLKWSTWLKPSSTAVLTGKAGQGKLLC